MDWNWLGGMSKSEEEQERALKEMENIF